VVTTEKIDWHGCPGVEFDPNKMSGAANIRGMRIAPDAVLDNFNDGMSAEWIKENFEGVQDVDIRNILSFASEHGFLRRPMP